MKLGYARVSTEDQRLDLQRARLKDAGCGKLFEAIWCEHPTVHDFATVCVRAF